jgi:hypothetical protein
VGGLFGEGNFWGFKTYMKYGVTTTVAPQRSEIGQQHDILSDIIYDRNLSKKPTTSTILAAEVKQMTGFVILARTVRDELRRMDVSFIRGRTRDPPADSEGNVAFRSVHLQNKVSNLNARRYPKLPEIYLDESYCNVNHVAGSTWLHKNSPRYTPSGKGQRYCIVVAGAVLVRNGKLHAEWVPDSLEYWPRGIASIFAEFNDDSNFRLSISLQWLRIECSIVRYVNEKTQSFQTSSTMLRSDNWLKSMEVQKLVVHFITPVQKSLARFPIAESLRTRTYPAVVVALVEIIGLYPIATIDDVGVLASCIGDQLANGNLTKIVTRSA